MTTLEFFLRPNWGLGSQQPLGEAGKHALTLTKSREISVKKAIISDKIREKQSRERAERLKACYSCPKVFSVSLF